MNKSQTISVIAITIFAAILLVGPVADDANAHNKKYKETSKDKADKKGKENKLEFSQDQKEEENKINSADQGISQTQMSSQSSSCSADLAAVLCGINAGLQIGLNTGGNALAQK